MTTQFRNATAHLFIRAYLTLGYITPVMNDWLLDTFSIIRLRDMVDDDREKLGKRGLLSYGRENEKSAI